MKPKLFSAIFCVVIIVSMTMITACFEKDVIEDVIGPSVETTPEPDMTTDITPPDEINTPVQPEMTPEMDPETTPEPDPLPDGEGLAIGATAPEFSLPDADGNLVSLSDYAGQKLVIAFFATYG